MKKIISIFLVLFLLINCFGYILFFVQQRTNIKNEVSNIIKTGAFVKDVVTFKFTEEEYGSLKFEEESEFIYHNEMYDVIKKEFKNNRWVIKCINDKKEETLICNFQKHSSSKNNNNNTTFSFLYHFITSALPIQYIIFHKENNLVGSLQYQSENILTAFNYILTPPPKSV